MRVNVVLPEQLAVRLQAIVDATGADRAEIIREALRRYVGLDTPFIRYPETVAHEGGKERGHPWPPRGSTR